MIVSLENLKLDGLYFEIIKAKFWKKIQNCPIYAETKTTITFKWLDEIQRY